MSTRHDNEKHLAKGKFWKRIRSILFLLPAWFSPHKSLRVLFHRLRGVDIGRNVEIGYYCIIGNVNPQMIHIEDNAVITANCVILEHDNSFYYTFGGKVTFGDVYIRKHSFIGIGSVIMPGVEIGEHSIVGAMSFVKNTVPAYSVVAGQPARLLKSIDNRVNSHGEGVKRVVSNARIIARRHTVCDDVTASPASFVVDEVLLQSMREDILAALKEDLTPSETRKAIKDHMNDDTKDV